MLVGAAVGLVNTCSIQGDSGTHSLTPSVCLTADVAASHVSASDVLEASRKYVVNVQDDEVSTYPLSSSLMVVRSSTQLNSTRINQHTNLNVTSSLFASLLRFPLLLHRSGLSRSTTHM